MATRTWSGSISTDRFTAGNWDTVVTGNGDDSGSQKYHATTPVAGLLYRLDPLTSLYVNYGQGFETPTFVELAYRNSGTGLNFDLQPAHSKHLEAGLKAVRPGLGRVNVAVFEIHTSDEIVVDTNSGGRATYKNAGGTLRRGLELGAESLWSGPFELRAAYSLLNAEFRDSYSTVVGTPSVSATVAAGNVLPGVPKQQFYAEAAWRYAPTGFRAAAELVHRDKVAVNDVNSEFAASFTVVNLVGGFEQQGGRWRLSEFLRVNNVADKAYIGSVVVNDANGRFYEPAPGRNVLVGLQAQLQF